MNALRMSVRRVRATTIFSPPSDTNGDKQRQVFRKWREAVDGSACGQIMAEVIYLNHGDNSHHRGVTGAPTQLANLWTNTVILTGNLE